MTDLCGACGLCCSGWIFGQIEMTSDVARALDLAVVSGDDEVIVPQPCPFHGGDHCRRYDDRPAGCRTFACETLKSLRSGVATEAEAHAVVARAREQVAAIEEALRRSGWAEPGEPGALAWRRLVVAARQQAEDPAFRRRHAESLILVAAYLTTIQRAFVADYVF